MACMTGPGGDQLEHSCLKEREGKLLQEGFLEFVTTRTTKTLSGRGLNCFQSCGTIPVNTEFVKWGHLFLVPQELGLQLD